MQIKGLKRILNGALLIVVLLFVDTAFAQSNNGISSPRDNAVVSGVVLVEGTASHPSFLRYEVAFFKESAVPIPYNNAYIRRSFPEMG